VIFSQHINYTLKEWLQTAGVQVPYFIHNQTQTESAPEKFLILFFAEFSLYIE
jgi:hypothetical protein